MKTKTTICILTCLLLTFGLYAGNASVESKTVCCANEMPSLNSDNCKKDKCKKVDFSKREEMAKKQAQHICEKMEFDDKTEKEFIKIYCNYQKELWELGPKASKKNPSDTAYTSKTARQIERSEKVLEIRKKYYKEFKKILTDKQIDKVFEIEKKMMQHLNEKRHKKHRRK